MDPSRPDGAGNGKVRAAMRSLCLLVAALLALAVPPVHAEDEGPPQRLPCFSYGEVARQLKATYDEAPVSLGLQANVLMPSLAWRALGRGARSYGLLLTAYGAGAVF